MTKKIFECRLYDFLLDEQNNVLIFDWKEETANMSDDDFRVALSNYAGFSFELSGPGLLVDVRKFKHSLGKEALEWRNIDCLPRYMAAGSYKMAYVAPIELLSQRPEGDIIIGDFTDRFFGSLDEASVWLKK